MKTQQMLSAHRKPRQKAGLAECIEACLECLQICTSCADACLSEEKVSMLARCIRSDLDCADMCDATARILSRQTEPEEAVIRAQVQALAEACRHCAAECDKHASKHEHCRICAEACRRCEQTCRSLV